MLEISQKDMDMIKTLGDAQADAQRKMRDNSWKVFRKTVECHPDDYETVKRMFYRAYDMGVKDCLINMSTVRSALIEEVMEGGDHHDGE